MIKFTLKVIKQEVSYPIPHEDEGAYVIALTQDGWLSGHFSNDLFHGDNDTIYTNQQVQAWFNMPDKLIEITEFS